MRPISFLRTMQLFTAYLGLESVCLSEKDARIKALQLAARHLPNGHTTIDARGRWLSPERGLVSEPTLLVQVWAERGDEIHQALLAMSRLYKNEACQDAVVVTAVDVEADFI